MTQQPLVGQERLINEASRSHSAGLLWTRDQPAQRPLPNKTQHSQEVDIRVPGGIRTHNPSKRAAADPRRKPRGDWIRLSVYIGRFL